MGLSDRFSKNKNKEEISDTEFLEVEPEDNNSSAKDNKNDIPFFKRIYVKIGIALVAIGCIIGIFCLIFNFIAGLDYMRPIKDICKIYNDTETDILDIYKLMYTGADEDAYKSAYNTLSNSESYYEYYKLLSSSLEDYYLDVAAGNEHDVEMIFDPTGGKEKMSENQLALINKDFKELEAYYQEVINDIDNMGKDTQQIVADELGISLKRCQQLCKTIKERCNSYLKYDISEGYVIKGRYVLTDTKKNTVDKTDKLTVSVIKLNDEWYIYDGASQGIALATGSEELAYTDMLWHIYEEYIK